MYSFAARVHDKDGSTFVQCSERVFLKVRGMQADIFFALLISNSF